MSYNVRQPRLYSSLEPTPQTGKNQVLLGLNGVVGWNTVDGNCILNNVQYYNNFSLLPATGLTNVLYGTNDTKLLYRWDGSAYISVLSTGILQDDMTWTNSSKIISWGQDNTSAGASLQVILKSKKKVRLSLQADSDNTGETYDDQPVIEMSSDGGATSATIALAGSASNPVTYALGSIDGGLFLNTSSTAGVYTSVASTVKFAVKNTVVESANQLQVPTNDTVTTPQYSFIANPTSGMQLTTTGIIQQIVAGSVLMSASLSEIKVNRKLNLDGNRVVYPTYCGDVVLSNGYAIVPVTGVTPTNCNIFVTIKQEMVSFNDMGDFIRAKVITDNNVSISSFNRAVGTLKTTDTSTVSWMVVFNS
jgi:hypothetical protein